VGRAELEGLDQNHTGTVALLAQSPVELAQ
jgi:hypothetical protein